MFIYNKLFFKKFNIIISKILGSQRDTHEMTWVPTVRTKIKKNNRNSSLKRGAANHLA